MTSPEQESTFVILEIPSGIQTCQPIPGLIGEHLSYGPQLGTALINTQGVTVLKILDHTRAQIISGLQENQLSRMIDGLDQHLHSSGYISKFNLWKFEAKKLFRYFTHNIKSFPIIHHGISPVDFVKTNFGGEEVNDIPVDILAEITGSSKTDSTYNFGDIFRAQLKDQFKTQTLQHEGVILIKVEHYDTNKIFSYIHVVKSEDEIENEYLRGTGDKEKYITFLWVDQARLFQSIALSK